MKTMGALRGEGVLTSTHYQILGVIRRHRSVSRMELSEAIGLSRSSIGLYADDLLRLNLLEEGEIGRKTGGRRSRMLQFHSKSGKILCVLIGANTLGIGLYNLYAEEVVNTYCEIDIAVGPSSVLERIAEIGERLLAETENSNLLGIAVGVPGPVNKEEGWVDSPPTMPGWHRFPIASWLQQRFKSPVALENDVNCMAVGERVRGAGCQYEDFVFVGIGSGIGAGIMSGGKLLRGVSGAAGELGHIQISDHNLCLCGRTGCLETVASGKAMLERAKQRAKQSTGQLGELARNSEGIGIEELAILALHGDEDACDIIKTAGEYLGKALTMVITTLNPEAIILGGDILTVAGDLYLASIQEAIYKQALPLATRGLKILSSSLIKTGGMVGACTLLVDELLRPADDAGQADVS